MKRQSYTTITGNKAVSYFSEDKEIARSVFTDDGVTVNIRGADISYKVNFLSQSDIIVSEWTNCETDRPL